jgi:hypothetical protein
MSLGLGTQRKNIGRYDEVASFVPRSGDIVIPDRVHWQEREDPVGHQKTRMSIH